MAEDLGERLVRVGLLTRAALAEALETAPGHGAELLRALVERGVSEDALAGFFVAEGFGPLLEARDLAVADPKIQRRFPTEMALEFLVYAVRDTTAGVVVAMASPTDRHILDETRRTLGCDVVPTVARVSDIEATVRAQRDDVPSGRARKDSEPPVLELTRRRDPKSTPGYAPRVPSAEPSGKLGPRVALAEPEGETPLLLVRHKAVPRKAGDLSSPAIPLPSSGTSPPAEGSRPAIPLAPKTFARPRSEGDRTITGEYTSGRPSAASPSLPVPATAPSAPVTPAAPATSTGPELPSGSIDEAVRRLTPATPMKRPDPEEKPAPQAAGEPSPRVAGLWGKGKAPSVAPAPSEKPAPTSSLAARRAAAEAAAPGPKASPLPKPPAEPPPAAAADAKPGKPTEAKPDPKSARELATLPPPSDRWSDLPEPSAAPAENKVSRGSLLGNKAPAGDIGPVLAGIRGARDRDSVVRLACDGAITVARAAVFLALKKGVLKGWDGAGVGISRDSVRNLWIPAGSASMFKRVLDEGVAYVGPYGAGIADGLFKAAVGSRGGDVMVQPVLLEGKVVGLLCVDDLRPGPLSRGRVEALASAVGDAFRRVISAGKE